MKRALYFLIGLNIVGGGGKVFADNSLTGLHLGFGLNVVADEYKSDVDVLGVAKYASGGEKWTFDGPDFYEIELNANTKLKYNTFNEATFYYSYSINDIISATFAEAWQMDGSIWRTLQFSGSGVDDNFVDFGFYYSMAEDGDTFTATDTYKQTYTIQYVEDGNNYYQLQNSCTIPASDGHLTADFINDIITAETSSKLIYGDQKAYGIKSGGTSGGMAAAYLSTSKPLKARTNRIGGELKMSYFHNITDHLILGLDVCGTLNQKAKKNIGIDKFNYTASGVGENKKYTIYCEGDSTIDAATYDGTKFINENGDAIGNTVYRFFKTATDEDGVTCIPERTYTIASVGVSAEDLAKELVKDNPGYTPISSPDPSQYLQISNEKGGDVTFEKNKFNSRAAVVLGAQYKGWFAGIRGGVSYNQGKIHAKDATGTSTEDVSFASPFVGVHLMKSINMKGLENGHIYVTADVNVQNKQNLKMKGIKNFRQNSVNVSLGMTWQIN